MNNGIKIRVLLKYEKATGKNALELFSKTTKSANDIYEVIGIRLLNAGTIKEWADLETVADDVVDKALTELLAELNALTDLKG